MKLKKILAAVMSAAMAVSAMALSSLTVSAEVTESYIGLKGNTASWAINADYEPKVMINTGTNSYDLTITNSNTYNDTFVGGEMNINFYDVGKEIKSASLTGVTVAGVAKNMTATAVEQSYLWNGTESIEKAYTIILTESQLAEIGDIKIGESVTFTVSVTYGEAASTTEKATELATTPVATGNWAENTIIAAASLEALSPEAGDSLWIKFDDVAADSQFAIKANWTGLPGFVEGSIDYKDLSAVANPYTYTLTEQDIAAIKGNELEIGGKNVTISKVVFVPKGVTYVDSGSTKPSESEKEPEEDTEKEPEEVKPIAINPSAPPADAISAKVFKVKLVNEGSKAKKVRVIAANDIITIRLDKANDGKYANIYVDDDCVDSVLIKYGRAKTKALDTEKFTVTITDKPVIEEAAE